MAFSPEPQPVNDPPYSEDAAIWQASDGIAGLIEATTYTAEAIKLLRRERDDAIATAWFNAEAADLAKAEALSQRLRAEGAEAELAEANRKLDEREEGIIWTTAERPAKGPNRPNKRKLSEFEASQIREYAQRTGAKVKEIANRWGVHSSTISRILNGKAY